MIDLITYGWNDKLNQLKQESIHKVLSHGRVTIVHRTCYEIVSGNGLLQCELTGNMLYGKSDFELPCVGDWVIFQPFDENKGIIIDMLPRKRILYRKKVEQLPTNRLLLRMSIKHLLCKALMIISMFAEQNVSWLRY